MPSLQICKTLEIRQQFERISEVRKCSTIAAFFLVCFTALVIFKVKSSTICLFQPLEIVKFIEENAENSAATDAQNVSTQGPEITRKITPSVITGEQSNSSEPVNATSEIVKEDHQLIGELTATFDKNPCLSRYQAYSYRKNQPYERSPYLTSKLRSYQQLHARCGPYTSTYRHIMRKLSKSSHLNETSACKYLVWTPANGLGNRMVSIASAFLYALLEHRVLLVEFEADMDDLFCETFPNSSWLLPKNFPHKNHWSNLPSFTSRSLQEDIGISHPFVYLHLQHGKSTDSIIRHFHCHDTQSLLGNIPVLILRSDQYFIPSLFMMPHFEEELNKMFPDKGLVFHLLGRYLFNPSNEAWGLITRFYHAYLAKADEKIGLQIRAFSDKLAPEDIMSEILACSLDNNILPSLSTNKSLIFPSQNQTSKSKAVLVASLYPQFSEQLRSMYWTKPTTSGEIIGVYQPSHEECQKFNDNAHNMKAWAEIYLLSLCDVLVTSGQSTFGYVAQGLGGSIPWILRRLGDEHPQKPACKRGISSEPCFHVPPEYECNGNNKINNITDLNPHLKSCEDLWWGVKLVT